MRRIHVECILGNFSYGKSVICIGNYDIKFRYNSYSHNAVFVLSQNALILQAVRALFLSRFFFGDYDCLLTSVRKRDF